MRNTADAQMGRRELGSPVLGWAVSVSVGQSGEVQVAAGDVGVKLTRRSGLCSCRLWGEALVLWDSQLLVRCHVFAS